MWEGIRIGAEVVGVLLLIYMTLLMAFWYRRWAELADRVIEVSENIEASRQMEDLASVLNDDNPLGMHRVYSQEERDEA